MNLRQIEYFLTIVKHMSYKMAAQELFITQPALSHAITKLEGELQLSLFFREGNRLILTDDGAALLDDFGRIESDFQALSRKAAQLRDRGENRSIRLGFSGSALFFSWLHMSDFLANWDGIPIQKAFADNRQLESMLEKGEIDLAITYPPIKGPGISSAVICAEKVGVAVPQTHPLAVCERIHPKDLEEYAFFGLTKEYRFRSCCDDLCEKNHIRVAYALEYNYQESFRLIAQNQKQARYLGFVTRDTFLPWFGMGYLFREIDEGDFARMTAISWAENRKTQFKYSALITYIEENYERAYKKHMYDIPFRIGNAR